MNKEAGGLKKTMKAIVKETCGPGFSLKEVPVPEELGPNEVLVKVDKA